MSSAMLGKCFYVELWHLLPSTINNTEKAYIVNRLRSINAEVMNKKYKHLGENNKVGSLRNFPHPSQMLWDTLEDALREIDYQIESGYLTSERERVYLNIIEFIKQKGQIVIDYNQL